MFLYLAVLAMVAQLMLCWSHDLGPMILVALELMAAATSAAA